ncbi:hypothetical protein JZ751_019375 [Albula glossodonta]|uniref:Uncharacterized protein n=1 Tax=Albula glossodonta TaxID=121402 RepID=A0A8T2NKM1_9TELE|nr:hypothetical protein JZ751_019375 [Albula glossodonta]
MEYETAGGRKQGSLMVPMADGFETTPRLLCSFSRGIAAVGLARVAKTLEAHAPWELFHKCSTQQHCN